MNIITTDTLYRLEDMFDNFMPRHVYLKAVYYQGIYYLIDEAHYDVALLDFTRYRSSSKLMQFSQFSLRMEHGNTIVLIKSRTPLEEVQPILRDRGYTVVADDGRTRPVEDW